MKNLIVSLIILVTGLPIALGMFQAALAQQQKATKEEHSVGSQHYEHTRWVTKDKTGCTYHWAEEKHLVNFLCPDGTKGHFVQTDAAHAFGVIYDASGKGKVMSFQVNELGKIQADTLPTSTNLPEQCIRAQAWCALQRYMNSVPEEQWTDAIKNMLAKPLCSGEEEKTYECNLGPNDWNPCPFYNDICSAIGEVPVLGIVSCAVSAACPYLR